MNQNNSTTDDDSWPQKRRKAAEPILRRICSALRIDEDISNLGLSPAREFNELFPNTDILAVSGYNFERPSLPGGSHMYCALNRTNSDHSFVELTPRNSSLSDLLSANWELLPSLHPADLANFILTIHLVGTKYHEVLTDITELDKKSRRDEGFVLNEESRRLMGGMLATSLDSANDCLTIHVLSLFGWMHEKQNLGTTDIRVARAGDLEFGNRQTHCDPVFASMPQIWY